MHFVLQYENRKMKPVEIVLRRGGWRVRKTDGEGESNEDLL
jgi:hypothetical protein